MDKTALTAALKQAAGRLGFTLVGVCPAVTPQGLSRFQQWLALGYAGQMHYLPDRAAAYEHPCAVLESVRSLVMLGMPYDGRTTAALKEAQGYVARYAWGTVDYHDLIHARLKQLIAAYRQRVPGSAVRGVVDTAPLLEREFAQLAGLGWVGKNTLLLNRAAGSYFFLAALLTESELEYDSPHQSEHCGTCTACLDACPTNAFPQPYVLDATRCISYLTIELRETIPRELRGLVGNWAFGCDICQEVCPWNRQLRSSAEPELQPIAAANPLDLSALFRLSEDQFRQQFRRTPLWRAKRRGILRNAAIVLGNQRSNAGLEPLQRGLHDCESLVRSSCAWALGRFGSAEARSALQHRLALEHDQIVRDEVQRALLEGTSIDER